MSQPGPSMVPSAAQALARWDALARAGLTLGLADLPAGAGLVQTAFGFGTEIWAMDGAADPAGAAIDQRVQKVPGARLVLGPDGRPAAPAAIARLGLAPVLKIPRL